MFDCDDQGDERGVIEMCDVVLYQTHKRGSLFANIILKSYKGSHEFGISQSSDIPENEPSQAIVIDPVGHIKHQDLGLLVLFSVWMIYPRTSSKSSLHHSGVCSCRAIE